MNNEFHYKDGAQFCCLALQESQEHVEMIIFVFGADDFGIVYSQVAPVQRLGARLTIVVLTLYYILVSSQRDRSYFCALSAYCDTTRLINLADIII